MTNTVTNAAELMTALETKQGGEILLAPGDYGELKMRGDVNPQFKYPQTLTLKPADPKQPFVFASLWLKGVENLSFTGGLLDYKFKDHHANWTAPFFVQDCTKVAIDGAVFDGDEARNDDPAADGFGTGYGLYVKNSSRVRIANAEFFKWMRGGVFSHVDGLEVVSNDVHTIRSDGFNFIAVKDVQIDENHFHDFAASPTSRDHRDFIQFWTSRVDVPCINVKIRNNFMNSGTGLWTQSIFMRNERVDRGEAGDEMFYRNILIEGNVIHNAHVHGITVGETDGLTIRDNTLLRNHGADDNGEMVWVPGINLKAASRKVNVENNVLPREITASDKLLSAVTLPDGWNIEGNLQTSDAEGDENYVGDLFAKPFAGTKATLKDLMARGKVADLEIGAPMLMGEEDEEPREDNLPAKLFVQGPKGLVTYARQ